MRKAKDPKRLKALESFQLLDTTPEKEYDEITSLAAFICEVPIALVSLVTDTRQFFKSHYGIDTSETPLELSFCAYAIENEKEIFIVPDTLEDKRFKDNPLVLSAPEIRFYAGVPLVVSTGEVLGALSVAGIKPKTLDEKQLKALKSLANQVVQLFELRKNKIKLEQSKKKLKLESKRLANIIEATRLGTWEWNVQTGEVNINERWAEIVGSSKEELTPIDINTWYKFLHPDDLHHSNIAIQNCFDNKNKYYNIECRMIHKEGHTVWINDRGKVISRTKEGKPLVMAGTHTDITKRKNTEIQFRTIANNIPGAVFRYRLFPNGKDKMEMLSKGAEKLWGISSSDAMENNQLIWDNYHKDDLEDHIKSIKKSAKNLSHWEHVWRYNHPDGSMRWQKGSGIPTKQNDGSIVWDSIILDITKEKELNISLEKSNERYKYVNLTTNDAIYDWDILNDHLNWGESFTRLLGHELNSKNQPISDYLIFIHASEKEQYLNSLKKALQNKKQELWEHEYRFQRADKSYAHVVEIGYILRLL